MEIVYSNEIPSRWWDYSIAVVDAVVRGRLEANQKHEHGEIYNSLRTVSISHNIKKQLSDGTASK